MATTKWIIFGATLSIPGPKGRTYTVRLPVRLQDGEYAVFDTKAEAERIASVWNATQRRVSYTVGEFHP